MKSIALAIIEDDPIIQDSLSTYFNAISNISSTMGFYSVEEFLESMTDANELPTIMLLDINLPGLSGIDGLPLIKDRCPDLDIIMLTTFEETDTIFKALSEGACSYISKRVSLEKISDAVATVNDGGSYMSPTIARKIANHFMPKKPKNRVLSDRQMDVVNGLMAGDSYKMIAADLYISIDTVRSHIKNIYKLLEINSKIELIRKSQENKL